MFDSAVTYIVENILTNYGPVVIGGALFLSIAWFFALWVGRILGHFLSRRANLEPAYATLIAQIARYSILVLAGIAVLQELGVEIASLIAALGIFGFALAIGLRTTSTNFFTGIMLFILKPYSVGDYIKGERVEGIVESMSLFHTVVVTDDGVFVAIPNAALWARSIENFSRSRPRGVELDISVARTKPFAELRSLIDETLRADALVVAAFAPLVRVVEVKSKAMKIRAVFWCEAEHEWEVRNRTSAALRAALTAAGVAVTRIGPTRKKAPKKKTEQSAPPPPVDDIG